MNVRRHVESTRLAGTRLGLGQTLLVFAKYKWSTNGDGSLGWVHIFRLDKCLMDIGNSCRLGHLFEEEERRRQSVAFCVILNIDKCTACRLKYKDTGFKNLKKNCFLYIARSLC